MIEFKTCNICNTDKSIDSFVKRSNRESGIQPYCKSCHNRNSREKYSSTYMREYDLKSKYGIGHSEFLKILESQDNKCAICKRDSEICLSGRKKRLCVDHSHDTGKVRGILCDKCNRGIGLLNDDPNVLISAYNYLINSIK
jgi:hypothetical protein